MDFETIIKTLSIFSVIFFPIVLIFDRKKHQVRWAILSVLGLIGIVTVVKMGDGKNKDKDKNTVIHKTDSIGYTGDREMEKSGPVKTKELEYKNIPAIIPKRTNPVEKTFEENKSSGKENYINNTGKNDIAVLIVDNNNHPVNAVSAGIASLYREKKFSVTTSLFTSSFLGSAYFEKVQNANSAAIEKLQLGSNAKYIVIGKYARKFETGENTKWICRASLDIAVISCITKSMVDGFLVTASSGYDDEVNAENGAIEKLLNKYLNTAHINLSL